MNHKAIAGVFLALALVLGLTGDGSGVLSPSSPVPGEGLHYLIVEDRPNRSNLPAAQFDAMFSTKLTDLVVTDLGGRAYLYDQNQNVTGKTDDPWVQKAMALPRGTLPWVIADFNGKGISEPFQNNLPDALNRVKQLVPQK